MQDNYSLIVQNNLKRLYSNLPDNIEKMIPAERHGNEFIFQAFGDRCRITETGIYLADQIQMNVLGILISLYALHANSEPCHVIPLKAFKDFPNTMPYVGAFATHTEKILIPYIERIKLSREKIRSIIEIADPPTDVGGDFSFLVFPLPKIALCYIFYEADDDFPPSATCLFSSNANLFMPIDGLADVGEYTSRKICSIFQ